MLPIQPHESGFDWSTYPEFIGCSPALHASLTQARQLAQTKEMVLIEGEIGTGKKLLARFIHWHSPRHRHPMLLLPCFGLSEMRLRDELFGTGLQNEDTGAERLGRVRQASGGTLVLEEISTLPIALQESLLSEVTRPGCGNFSEAPRLIVTTSLALAPLVKAGRFLPELYQLLSFNPIRITPLHERKDDIIPLAEHFLRTSRRGGSPKLSLEFLNGLESYHWPGNVNELASAMRRIGYLSDGETITARHLKMALPIARVGLSLRDVQRQLLEMTLSATSGNRTKAAEMLGISVRTVRNKIREYGLEPRRQA